MAPSMREERARKIWTHAAEAMNFRKGNEENATSILVEVSERTCLLYTNVFTTHPLTKYPIPNLLCLILDSDFFPFR